MKKIFVAGMGLIMALSLGSCRDKSRKQAIADERMRWEASLSDSLASYERQLGEAEKNIPALREEVQNLLSRFTPVNNPREVEGYYIYTPAKGRYPLASTGITARLTKSEAPEVIAALKGGNFSSIRISTPDGRSVTSVTVPYDQALNYRAGGLNTVAFSGESADSIVSFVADNPDVSLTVEYLNPGSVAKAAVSNADRETLLETGRLVEVRRRLHRAETEIPMLSRKIQRLKSRAAENAY